MDLVLHFKCIMGLYYLDLSNYLVTADSSKYNLRHADYLFKLDMQEPISKFFIFL